MAQIQLGSFFSANGKTVLGGVGGSGLDTQGLIKALTDARGLPATKLQDKIDLNDKTTTALGEMKTLIDQFRDAANFLRNPPGVNNAADNVFKHVTTSVSSNISTQGSDFLSVTVNAGTPLQNFTITEITSLAKATKQTSNTITVADADTAVVEATPAAGEFGAGTFTVRGASITLDTDDTLNTIAAKFNAVKGTTKIAASVLKVADNSFKLVFTATETGETAGFDLDSGSIITSDPSNAISLVEFDTTQPADNASFVIDGETIERESNSISDVFSGITFNLLQTTPEDEVDLELTVTLKPDNELVKSGIINFVNVYNDFRTFYAKQTLSKDDGTASEDATLINNSTLRTAMNSISAQMSAIVNGIASSPNRLADVGISSIDLPATDDTPFVRNAYTIDEAKLDAAIEGNFDALRKVFEFNFSSTNTHVTVFSHPNTISASSMTLTLNPSTQTFTATIGGDVVTLDKTDITGGGYKLTGPSGSAIEGLVLIYGSETDSTSSLTFSQGIADLIYNTTDGLMKKDTGAIDVELKSIQDRNTKLEEDITRINEQVDSYREQLLQKFGQLEQAISTVNTLLASLQAQADARNNA